MRPQVILSLGVCGLVASGYFFGKLAVSERSNRWDPGSVYAMWCVAAEAAANKADGTSWDDDASPPDLSAEINWRGNRVLKSATARNTMLASWDRSSFELSDLLRTQFRPGDLDKVARIKADRSEKVTVVVYDRDVLGSEIIGSADITLGDLREGINRLEFPDAASGLKSLSLQVVSASTLERGGQLPERLYNLPLPRPEPEK